MRQQTEDQSAVAESEYCGRRLPGPFRRACSWIAEKRLFERGYILAIISTFVCSTSVYLRNYRRYSQVASWPSVPATVQSLASHDTWTPYHNRWGGLSTIHQTHTNVRFTYTVAGVAYQGTRPSPDEEIPTLCVISVAGVQTPDPAPRAYYQPSDPSIAVLYPLAYQGFGVLAAAIASGALLGLYGYFSLRR